MTSWKRKQILVVMATVQKARRDKLAGIYDYAHDHGWTIQTIEDPSNAPLLTAALRSNSISGIISDGFNAPVNIPSAVRRALPTVYIDRPARAMRTTGSINNDDDACAELAARTLADLGLRHLAAVGTTPSVYWSKKRVRAFAEHARHLGCRCVSFKPSDDLSDDLSRLRDWLKALPRPCGLFAVTDAVAKRCIELLIESGVRVPEEVAVIGIDNNELVCENTTPSITSILPGFRLAGRLAAERLDRLMCGVDCDDLPTTYGPQTVVRRSSTQRIAPAARKIGAVVEFIRTHACLGIRVPDVMAFAALPKSTLELHFRQATGRSIAQEIQRIKLEQVTHLLSDGNCPLSLLAQRCGYRNDNHLKNLFKRKFGVSLSQYRKSWRTA